MVGLIIKKNSCSVDPERETQEKIDDAKLFFR